MLLQEDSTGANCIVVDLVVLDHVNTNLESMY